MKSADESFGLHARPGILDPAWDAENSKELAPEVHSWHVHHYFEDGNEESTRESLELREKAMNAFPNLTIGRPRRSGAIVHPVGFWVLELHTVAQFEKYITWLVFNHGKTNALVHPNTHWDLTSKIGGEYVDHTDRSFWIGNPRDIPKLQEGVERRFFDVISKDAKIDPLSNAEFKAGRKGADGYFAEGYGPETVKKMETLDQTALTTSPAQDNDP